MVNTTIGTYREHRNAQCVHCGHIGFSSEFPDEPVRHPTVCCHCSRAGRTMLATTEPEPPPPAASDPVTWGGHVVTAPGFSQDQFERAMVRAFVDDLQLKAIRGEQYMVHHAGLTHGYRVSRERCDCPAGQAGTPCKHRAVLIAHLDIRAPHIARAWQKLMTDRPLPGTSPEVA
jgi:hypothetical protein